MAHELITERILQSAFNVHADLGANLLESSYTSCLQHEFNVQGLQFKYQVPLPVVYQGVQLEAGYRIDFLVEESVIVEVKAVEKLLPLHTAQLITHLKLSGLNVGPLLNFNVPHLTSGIRRVVNGYPAPTENALPAASSAPTFSEAKTDEVDRS